MSEAAGGAAMNDGGAGEVRRHQWSWGGLGLVTRLHAAKMQGQGVTVGSGCHGEVPAELFDSLQLVFPALSSHQVNKISPVQLGRSADAWRCPLQQGCQIGRDLPQKRLIPFVAV